MCINVSVVSCLMSVKHLVGESCVFSSSFFEIILTPPLRFIALTSTPVPLPEQTAVRLPHPQPLLSDPHIEEKTIDGSITGHFLRRPLWYFLWPLNLLSKQARFALYSYFFFFFLSFFSHDGKKNHKSFETLRLSMQTCKITLVINFG